MSTTEQPPKPAPTPPTPASSNATPKPPNKPTAAAKSSDNKPKSRTNSTASNRRPQVKKDETAPSSAPASTTTSEGGPGVNRLKSTNQNNRGGGGENTRRTSNAPAGTKQPTPPSSSGGSTTNQQTGNRRTKSPATNTSSNNNRSGGRASTTTTSTGLPPKITTLESLNRIITDLRSIPPPPPGNVTSPPKETPPTTLRAPAAASSPATSPALSSKLPNPNAPVFHPSQQTLDLVSEEQDQFEGMPPIPAPRQQQPVATQQPMGSFTAPRFAALAAAQEQNQLDASRPVLAPAFTFGARRRSAALEQMGNGGAGAIGGEEDVRMGGAGASGPGMGALLGLAARAHRRTGSEMSPVMTEQVRLQQQIEDLQRQQRELIIQSQAIAPLPVLPNMPMGFSSGTSSIDLQQPINRHRRIQSVAPSPTVHSFDINPAALSRQSFTGYMPQQQFQPQHSQQSSFGGGPGDVPFGHGRRHSVNVSNRPMSIGGQRSDWSEDGFGVLGPQGAGGYPSMGDGMNSGSHSRQGSRMSMDGSWRINGGVGPVQQNGGANMNSDLAQAQAQLQSIASFRAAAGGGHSKMASFALPNMLPNLLYANAAPYLNIPQQIQAFQLQIQQQSNQPQRKSLFSPYLPAASLPPLLAAGKLVIGILRVNKRNRSDAYIATEVLDADIYISGSRDRNRALDGDTVAVELLDVDEVWASKKEKEDKKRKKEENAAYNDIRAMNQAANSRRSDKKKDDVEVEGQGMMLFDDEEVTDETKPQFAGHVVAVVERMPGQLFSGVLGLLRPSSAVTKEKQEAERREREGPGSEKPRAPERPKIVWFKPTDKRVPLIAIPTEQAPADFLERSEAYSNTLFCASLKRWPITSLHPFGTLVEEIGSIGQVEVETSALLKDCNFPTEDFTESVIKCLPPLPWTIPNREFEVRKDLRENRIFTIDPETAKDLDDALSVTRNEDGTFEVGVHIADVSYFVKPNTALDRDARKRATSVYLVQRAVPMLPPTLCEELCSLVPGEDRLAFSVFFTITADGRVVRSAFERTIIKSCAKLAYSNAQAVIDGESLGQVKVADEHSVSEVEGDIKILHTLAKKLSERRFEKGALRIDTLKLDFKLDANGLPTDCSAHVRKDANSLVEEFMLLANFSAATMVAANLPEQALLRRHEAPIDRRIEGFVAKAARLNFTVDGSSAGALQKSFNLIEASEAKRLLEVMSTKAMHKAKYFCSGMLDIAKYSHYALNAPLYTHFTSPIRRYADVIVHRQLAACIEEGSPEAKFLMDRDTVAKTAQNCNMKKEGAKLAQEQSAHLFLCLLLHDLTERYGPVVREAHVVNVLDSAFDVIVPEFGIEKRVHADQMPLENHVYDEHTDTLQLYWSDRDVITFLAERGDDEHLNKVKKLGDHHAQLEVSSRAQDENALFDDDEDEEEAEEIVVKGRKLTQAEEKESIQRSKSAAKTPPVFQGLRTPAAGGHRIQDIRELMTVPVIISADLEKSPPVIKVFAVNPYAAKK
ncbi:hypothetical protein BDY24DRAFT_36922 [Mrakia frigida]|uniref:uncharacterized protein n=1 Tax=Mrakia frigida TaxID=29902 RepID=UPI003FCC045D